MTDLLDPPASPTADETYQTVEILWRFVDAVSKLNDAQKRDLDKWIAEQWGIVVLRVAELEKMRPELEDTMDAFALLDSLMG